MAGRSRIRVANIVVNLAMGGIERLSIQLCAHLAPDIFDPVLVCIGGGGPLEREADEYGVRVVKLGKNVKNVPGAVIALSKKLREIEIDVVHGNPGLIARLAAPESAAVVSTYHNLLKGRSYLTLLADRYLVRRTDALVGITGAVASNAENALRLPAGTFRVIYNGVDIKKIRTMAQEPTDDVRGSDGQVVCFVGRLAPEKGVDILIDAFASVLEKVADVRLWIVGEGPERPALESRARGLGSAVVFLGWRINPYPFLAAADVYCVPSLEGAFELVIPEAMALGLPIVASRTGGIPEVVGDAGVLVEPEDYRMLARALISLLEDEENRSRLSKRSTDRAGLFGIERTAAEYAAVYEEAAGLGA